VASDHNTPLTDNGGGVLFDPERNYKKLPIGVCRCSAATFFSISFLAKEPFGRAQDANMTIIDYC
jgi:hypothetical protein